MVLVQQWYRRRQKEPKRTLDFSLGFSVKGFLSFLSLYMIFDGFQQAPYSLKPYTAVTSPEVEKGGQVAVGVSQKRCIYVFLGGGGLYHSDYSILRSSPMYGSCQVSSLLFGPLSDKQTEASAVEDSVMYSSNGE